jgi:hypothetical protein
MVSPRICAQRIHDLQYTVNPALPQNWNLPQDLIPAEEDAGLPTKNLLGWSSATTLTTEQRVLLEGANVREDDFGATNPRFMMNKPLFESIADRVRILDRVVKLGASVHESITGSVCQTQ